MNEAQDIFINPVWESVRYFCQDKIEVKMLSPMFLLQLLLLLLLVMILCHPCLRWTIQLCSFFAIPPEMYSKFFNVAFMGLPPVSLYSKLLMWKIGKYRKIPKIISF